MSPIALMTVAAAAVAVAVVAVLQREDAGRLSVRDAWAEPDMADPSDLRIYLTLVNDGGDDQVIGFKTPLAGLVTLVGASADVPQGALTMPARSALTLDSGSLFILAEDVAWDEVTEDGLPLVLDLAHSDAIFVSVPITATRATATRATATPATAVGAD